ncbi:type III restriction/modification system enzyme [Neisseria gonorrhoeae]|uniref:Type III restriction/modification system enzyme n=1 Tax=Neisseria gonorrhoeae TaxID=485 RepID=A0A378VZN4_NEIGO|nr:type III restriction/modification system enzyme [Neisseria gonorrhoeae]
MIGRGVRYFPFAFEGKQPNKRKFDNDMQHELRILEELFYYTHDEQSRYITELKNELRKDGYLPEKTMIRYWQHLSSNLNLQIIRILESC